MQTWQQDGAARHGAKDPDAVPEEDRVSAVALTKTVACFAYTIIAVVVTEVVVVVANLDAFPGRAWIRLGILLPLQATLVFLGLLGRLPLSRARKVRGFTDRQFALAVSVMSLLPLALGLSPLRAEVFRWVTNGTLLVGVLVFFVTKSVLSGRPRLAVLAGMVVPGLQLAWCGLRPLLHG